MKSIRLLIVISLTIVWFADSASAQWGEELPDSYQEASDRYGFRQKLRRGVTNLATGWLEIPFKTVGEVMFGTRSPMENLTIGVIVGTTRGMERTLIGAFETATFYIPSYDPILKPEYAQLSFGSISQDLGDPREGLHVRPVEPIGQ